MHDVEEQNARHRLETNITREAHSMLKQLGSVLLPNLRRTDGAVIEILIRREYGITFGTDDQDETRA